MTDRRKPPASRPGRFVETAVAGERVRAFVPPPLPPVPPIRMESLLTRLGATDRALGRLDGVDLLLPERTTILYMYVRKEAVLSSQIEGTQSTLADLLRFETGAKAGAPFDDVREVSSYVDALMHGLARLETLPLSLRLIRELHARLLRSGRGAAQRPGEFRTTQNWVGGTRPGNAIYVPPPADALMPCLDAFERFLHAETPDIPPLVKAGLLHVQFESIHPFLDGNGRIGRLLITLFLCAAGVMHQPLLYLSLYFRRHRADYYRLLQEVREQGAWEAWLEFFLDGVAETAAQALDGATRITALFAADRAQIDEGAQSRTALRVHALLQTSPYLTAQQATTKLGLSTPTVNQALARLERLGVVEEITGRKRGRVYCYRAYMRILGEDGGRVAD